MPDSSQAAEVLENLIREREPTLRAMARVAAGPDADDAFQNACVGFLRSFDPDAAYGGLDGAQQYLQAAIFNAGRRLGRTETRRERALPRAELRPDLPGQSANPEEELLRALDREDRLAELRELPEEWRHVLVAREAGYSPAEIQGALNLTPRQYRKRIDKARHRLGVSA